MGAEEHSKADGFILVEMRLQVVESPPGNQTDHLWKCEQDKVWTAQCNLQTKHFSPFFPANGWSPGWIKIAKACPRPSQLNHWKSMLLGVGGRALELRLWNWYEAIMVILTSVNAFPGTPFSSLVPPKQNTPDTTLHPFASCFQLWDLKFLRFLF